MNNFGMMGEPVRRDKEIISITRPNLDTIVETLNSFNLGTVLGVEITLKTFISGWSLHLEAEDKKLDISGNLEWGYSERLSKIFAFKPELHVAMFEVYELLEDIEREFYILENDCRVDHLIQRIYKYYGNSWYGADVYNGYEVIFKNVDCSTKYLEECVEQIRRMCGEYLVGITISNPDIIVVLK